MLATAPAAGFTLPSIPPSLPPSQLLLALGILRLLPSACWPARGSPRVPAPAFGHQSHTPAFPCPQPERTREQGPFPDVARCNPNSSSAAEDHASGHGSRQQELGVASRSGGERQRGPVARRPVFLTGPAGAFGFAWGVGSAFRHKLGQLSTLLTTSASANTSAPLQTYRLILNTLHLVRPCPP